MRRRNYVEPASAGDTEGKPLGKKVPHRPLPAFTRAAPLGHRRQQAHPRFNEVLPGVSVNAAALLCPFRLLRTRVLPWRWSARASHLTYDQHRSHRCWGGLSSLQPQPASLHYFSLTLLRRYFIRWICFTFSDSSPQESTSCVLASLHTAIAIP